MAVGASLLEKMGYFLSGFFGVVHSCFAGLFQALAALARYLIGHMIGLFAALGRFHCDFLAFYLVDTLDSDLADFQATFADVVDFFGGIFGTFT